MNRGLRILSIATVALTASLLALGAFVTSFRVGMADPVWPTEPWRLALIDWSEPDPGFIVEHTHRLFGFAVGGLMSALALGLACTEARRGLRWYGLASIIGLLGAYGWLHGVLIRQAKTLAPGATLTVPPTVAAALAAVALAIFVYVGLTLAAQSPGWLTRALGVVLLLAVMVQGLLGGFRVHLNVLFGDGLAAIHGSFSQVVFGLAVLITCLLKPAERLTDDVYSYPPDALTRRPVAGIRFWAVLAIIALFSQIVAGAMLRHTAAAWAGRLHLLIAFVASAALLISATRLQRAQVAPIASGVVLGLLAIQVALGVEAWLARFGDGFAAALIHRITWFDAILRSGHAVTGYLLFAMAIVLAVAAGRATQRQPVPEAVA